MSTPRRGPAARWPAAVAAATALALLAAACGGSSTTTTPSHPPSVPATFPTVTAPANGNTASAPGITATQVTIGSHQALTATGSAGPDEIAPAAQSYFNYLNAHGGIHGRTIAFRYLDDGYNPVKTSSVVRELLGDKVFAIVNGFGTRTHQAVVKTLAAQAVPDLFIGSGCTCWNHPARLPTTFGWQPSYVAEGKVLGHYVATKLRGKTVGYLYQNDDYGQEGIRGLALQIPAGSVVDRESYSVSGASLASQVSRLKAAKAQVVVSFSIPSVTAQLVQTAAELNFHPQFVVSADGSDPATVLAAQKVLAPTRAASSATDGLITDAFLPSADDRTSGFIALFRAIHDADPKLRQVPFDGNVVYGMSVAYTFAQALAAAGQNPTRASLVAALQLMTFTGPGLGPLRYTTDDHGGYRALRLGKINGGVLTLSGPLLRTDSGGGPVTAIPVPRAAAAPTDGVPPAG